MKVIYTVDVSRDVDKPWYVYAGEDDEKAHEIAYLTCGKVTRHEITLENVVLTRKFGYINDAGERSKELLNDLGRFKLVGSKE